MSKVGEVAEISEYLELGWHFCGPSQFATPQFHRRHCSKPEKVCVSPSESATEHPRDNLFSLLWQPEEGGTWMNSRTISPDIQGIFI